MPFSRVEPFAKVHLKALFRDFGGSLLQVRQGVVNYDAKHLEQNAPKERKVAKATFAKGSVIILAILPCLNILQRFTKKPFVQTFTQEKEKIMSQQHTKSEKRARRKRYAIRLRERINEAKAAAKKK